MWMFFALSSLIASIGCILFAFLAFFSSKESKLNKSFASISFIIGVWSFFPFITSVLSNYNTALFSGRLVYAVAVFTPPVFFHFMFVAMDIYENFNKNIIKISYIISIVLLCFSFSKFFIKDIIVHSPNTVIVPGPIYAAFAVFFVALCAYAQILYFKKYRITVGYKKEQMKFLLLAFFIALIAGSMHIFSAYINIEIFPHDILLIIWAGIVFYSISKYKFLNMKMTIVRSFLLIFIYCIVLGVPFYIGFTTKMWFLASVLMFILSTTGPLFFKYLERRAEQMLLAEQEKYHQFLMQASKGMVDQHDLEKLSKLIVIMIKRSVKLQFVSLFIYDEKENCYTEIAARGFFKKSDLKFDVNSEVINFIKTAKDEPMLFFDMPSAYKKRFSRLSENIHVIVPSVLRKELVAFLVLGEKNNGSMYSVKDFEVFKTLSNQAALAIENCVFIEKSKEHQKRLFEAEKLASIGGMADGLAHQIKNRLNQFALIGGELGLEIEDFESKYKDLISKEPDMQNIIKYIKEISESISSNVTKTNTVLKGILGFAKTAEKDTMFSYFSLRNIVEQSLQLIQVKHSREQLPVILEIPEEDNIYGVKSQIQEVVFNCLDNAFEALVEKDECLKNSISHEIKMKNIQVDKFIPEIRVGLKFMNKSAKIYIQDNGIGIKDEDAGKIFSAFFTTKPSSKSGSGIGTYVTKRIIVENHKGSIDFKSKYGFGTTFVITLPMSKDFQSVDTDVESA